MHAQRERKMKAIHENAFFLSASLLMLRLTSMETLFRSKAASLLFRLFIPLYFNKEEKYIMIILNAKRNPTIFYRFFLIFKKETPSIRKRNHLRLAVIDWIQQNNKTNKQKRTEQNPLAYFRLFSLTSSHRIFFLFVVVIVFFSLNESIVSCVLKRHHRVCHLSALSMSCYCLCKLECIYWVEESFE